MYIYIYIRYSEVKINYLKYFGMLPSSVNLFLFIYIYVCMYRDFRKIFIFTIKQESLQYKKFKNFKKSCIAKKHHSVFICEVVLFFHIF